MAFFSDILSFQRILRGKREGVLPPPPAWRAGERGQEIDRMGQTGSRVASKIANSFTFHGSPRYKIECEEKIC